MPECEITTSSVDDVESLWEYVVAEGIPGVRPSLAPGRPRPGEQGAAEVLTVLFTSGSGLALAQAVNAWIRTRQKKVVLTLRRTADGQEATLESTGPTVDADLMALLTSWSEASSDITPPSGADPATGR